MNYRSLAAHNSACNWVFHKFQDCENEHPYRKFFGYCEQIQKEMNECIREQRQIRRKENSQYRRRILQRHETLQKINSD